MEQVFLKLLNMSISASWLVLAVAVLRLILKKAPKWVNCVLWALVAVRLICPVSLESVMSLIPSGETVPRNIAYESVPAIHSGVQVIDRVVNPVVYESFAPTQAESANPLQAWTFIGAWIWIVGMGLMALYALASCLQVRGKVSASMKVKGNVWICDYIDSPFIFGILRPRIYLPSAMMEDGGAVHVLAHERAHLKRKDHWWKPLGFVLLTVYWFNPVLWVAYVLLCRDIELACDERVVKELGDTEKKAYSEALLQCSVPRRMIAACPLAFGEVGVKARVKSVLNYKKPAFWVMVVAIAVCIAVAVCFLTDPVEEPEETEPVTTQPTEITEPAPTQPIGGIDEGQAGDGAGITFGDNTMSLRLPEGWKYETVSEDSGTVSGVAFWPEGVSDGRVKLVLMEQHLGLCGTGLETEEVTFPNGLVGSMGTYDNHPYWSFITFTNAPGYYVALTEGVESWWDQYEDQVMEILGSAELGVGIVRKEEAIAAAQRVTGEFDGYWSAWYDTPFAIWRVEQYESMEDSDPKQAVVVDSRGYAVSPDEWGILLTATNVSPSGVTLNCIQSGGTVVGDLMTGQHYWLERWNGTEWENVPVVNEKAAWTTEALVLPKNDTASWNLNWEWIYGKLSQGSYRIGKNISNYRGWRLNEEVRKFYAGFEIGATLLVYGDGNGITEYMLPGEDSQIIMDLFYSHEKEVLDAPLESAASFEFRNGEDYLYSSMASLGTFSGRIGGDLVLIQLSESEQEAVRQMLSAYLPAELCGYPLAGDIVSLYSEITYEGQALSCRITDKTGTVLFERENLPREPKIEQISADVLSVSHQAGLGLSTRWTVCCDVENGRVSETFYYVLGARDNYVVYVTYENKVHSIVVQDIFDKSAYYKLYELENVSPTTDPVADFVWNSEGGMTVTYLTGENYAKTVITIDLPQA